MEEGDFLHSFSPLENSYITILPSTSGQPGTNKAHASPAKKDSLIFSPFKTSGLSPFKSIDQSPSKGSLDEWEKDLMASFQENVFGIDENVISPNILEDIMNSPTGKAIFENRNSPLRMKNGPTVRRLKISPHNKNTSKSFQALSDDSGLGGIVNDFDIKEENVTNDHLYGQTVVGINQNTLSAIDPNKMSATPCKPSLTPSENVPKRKLAMKMPEPIQPFQAFVIQDNAISGIQQVMNDWPSKERLKFARLQFTRVLNMAVEKEIEILKEERRKKTSTEKSNEKENCDQIQVTNKPRSIKAKKVIKASKGKGKSKRSRPDKYPQIKMALSKPMAKRSSKGPKLNKNLFFARSINHDLGWYPDDEDDDDEDLDYWSGPVPFNNGTTEASLYGEDESSDEEASVFNFETQSGRQVTWKKRRY